MNDESLLVVNSKEHEALSLTGDTRTFLSAAVDFRHTRGTDIIISVKHLNLLVVPIFFSVILSVIYVFGNYSGFNIGINLVWYLGGIVFLMTMPLLKKIIVNLETHYFNDTVLQNQVLHFLRKKRDSSDNFAYYNSTIANLQFISTDMRNKFRSLRLMFNVTALFILVPIPFFILSSTPGIYLLPLWPIFYYLMLFRISQMISEHTSGQSDFFMMVNSLIKKITGKKIEMLEHIGKSHGRYLSYYVFFSILSVLGYYLIFFQIGIAFFAYYWLYIIIKDVNSHINRQNIMEKSLNDTDSVKLVYMAPYFKEMPVSHADISRDIYSDIPENVNTPTALKGQYIVSAILFGLTAGFIAVIVNTISALQSAFIFIFTPGILMIFVAGVIAPVVEEGAKVAGLYLIKEEENENFTLNHWCLLGFLSGLAFALVEDYYYFINVMSTYNITAAILLMLLRLSIPVHMIGTVLSAYGLGLWRKTGNHYYAMLFLVMAIVVHSSYNIFVSVI